MNSASSFVEAARRAFHGLPQELKKSEDDNFIGEPEEFIKLVKKNEIDEEYFYKYLYLLHAHKKLLD
jgi:hypothetical protein